MPRRAAENEVQLRSRTVSGEIPLRYNPAAMPRNVRVIMFDWGGTLALVARQDKSRAACAAAAVARARERGGAVTDEDTAALLELFLARTTRHEREATLEELDTPAMLREWVVNRGLGERVAGLIDELAAAFWQPWLGCLDVLPGVIETLRRLRLAGYAMGLVSNCAAMPATCRAEAARLGMAPMLDFMLFSSELGVRKPHEGIYARAMALATAIVPDVDTSSVLFVGDTPVADVDGPGRQGMRTALVRTGRWGGDRGVLRHIPDVILDSVNDLPGVLARVEAADLITRRLRAVQSLE
jgi:FMN phosphatase YigB (HAD superfamily)